jgi:hypothetical protein
MRKTLMTAALVFALCRACVAGEMPTPPAPTTTTPPANATQGPAGGEMPFGITQNDIMPNDAADGLTRIALDLLAVLPSLL